MKRMLRVAALFAALLVLCVSLCGCDELDEMRIKHALWNEDGTISWGDKTYVEISEHQLLTMMETWEPVYVTESDVPLLFSEDFGDEMWYNPSQPAILCDYYNERYYCAEEEYDDIIAMLKGEEEIGFTKWYHVYYDDNAEAQEYVLSEEQKMAFEQTIAYGSTVGVSEYSECLGFWMSTADGLFTELAFEAAILTEAEGGRYILIDHRTASDFAMYVVPDEYIDTFEKLFDDIYEIAGYEYTSEEWPFLYDECY